MSELDPSRARLWERGHRYEDFEEGRVFEHRWGRTVTEADNTLFTTLTLSYNPLYFDAEHARRLGHPTVVVNPMLVFCVVFGLTVEDLSEGAGLLLGVEDLAFHRPVYPGDTLRARSTVLSRRVSESRPGQGVVSWRTEGRNQRGELVVAFTRTNLVPLRGAA